MECGEKLVDHRGAQPHVGRGDIVFRGVQAGARATELTQVHRREAGVERYVRHYGGSGVKFEWNMLNNYKLPHPFILSGGIGQEDADTVKKFKHPQLAGIDINSRFETEPGLKNVRLLKKFLENVRS